MGDGAVRLDMGAYEAQAPTVPVIVTLPQSLTCHVYDSDLVSPAELLTVTRRGAAAVGAWRIDCNAPWLRIQLKGGITGDEVSIFVDGTSMALGAYRGDLQIHASCAANTRFRVPVQLQIGNTLRVPGAYETLQEAVDAAAPGDLITMADGLYTGPGNQYVHCEAKGLTIRSERGPGNCIIDYNTEDFEYRTGIEVFPGGNRLVLEGLTIMRAEQALGISGANVTLRGSPW